MSTDSIPKVGLLRTHIGSALRRARIAQGQTLRQLSREASVSLGYLSEIERGQKEASSELLASICHALSLSIPNLLVEVSRSISGSLEDSSHAATISPRPTLAPTLAIVSLENTSVSDALNIEDAA